MIIKKKAEKFEGNMWWVLRKISWGFAYTSVDGGKTWILTGARKVAFEWTPREDWLPVVPVP